MRLGLASSNDIVGTNLYQNVVLASNLNHSGMFKVCTKNDILDGLFLRTHRWLLSGSCNADCTDFKCTTDVEALFRVYGSGVPWPSVSPLRGSTNLCLNGAALLISARQKYARAKSILPERMTCFRLRVESAGMP